MTKPLHIMLDLETMGTAPGAQVAAIGACTFGHPGPRLAFYARAELRGQDRLGLHADADTVLWWMGQPDAARAQLTKRAKLTLPEALLRFCHWVRPAIALDGDEPTPLRIWCNGANFDAPVIEHALRAVEQPVPWHYADVRCLRTLLDLAGVDRKAFPPKIPHHALHDALAQADAAQAAFVILADRKEPAA